MNLQELGLEKAWNELIWLRTGTSGGLQRKRVPQNAGILRLAEELPNSQGTLCNKSAEQIVRNSIIQNRVLSAAKCALLGAGAAGSLRNVNKFDSK
jgi:hypothetical protein